ncbi:DUF4328 domain-containing protein [Microscilla marina]|uniref:DUF4328 domain-containing protein n=1 Tax=Microscilla marina ATCC 23134 TaxID=313606 RepID=A1ZK81_MICM2|nr:DUF4328 domain-containing protein [Microscilla marina]EAY29107.1 hypothetical protein M23134_02298 [Microscilla marina ATCC 23134]
MNNLKPNDQRAKTAITLIWVVMVVEVIALISSYLQYDLIQSAVAGASVTIEEANANDARERLVAIVYLIVLTISGITFIQWFRRAYYNLHQRVDHLNHSEGWAAGAWFVPFLNLFRPFQIMKELYEETAELLATHEFKDKGQLSTSVLGVWWAAWILKSVLGQVSFRLAMNAKEIAEIQVVTIMSIAQHVLGIIAAFLVVQVIREYARVEPALMEFSYEDQINNIGTDRSDEGMHENF